MYFIRQKKKKSKNKEVKRNSADDHKVNDERRLRGTGPSPGT